MKVLVSYQRLRIVRRNRKCSKYYVYYGRKKKTRNKELTDKDLDQNVFIDL